MSETVAAEVFRVARESIVVLPPPFDGVVAEARAQRRRRRRTVLASVAAAVAVVAGVGWAVTRPPAEEPTDPRWTVTRQPNPVDVAWYAGGQLHLARVTLAMPAIGDLVAVEDGAAFTDSTGTVYFAAADGAVTELGRTGARDHVAASGLTDWVAWVDPSGDAPRLVVHDLVSGEDLATRDLADGGAVVAIDQGRVYYATAAGDFVWEPGNDPVRLERTGLLDVASGTQVYATGDGIEMVQGVFRTSLVRPGTGAMISPGGGFVLSRAGARATPFRPLLYAVRSGDRMPSGLSGGELALGASFGPNHTVSYLVAPRADLGSGPDLDGNTEPLVVLRTCDLDPVVCHDVIPLARRGERPLLAH